LLSLTTECPTRLSRLRSPVRPVRRRLIRTTRVRRRREQTRSMTNKKTGANTPVPMIIMLLAEVAAMPIHFTGID